LTTVFAVSYRKALKNSVIALLAILFLHFFTSLGLPDSSQNYTQFLTGVICARSDTDWCNESNGRTIIRIVETQESVVYRFDAINDSMYDNLVEIGSINSANTLRENSPNAKYFEFHANHLGQDVTSLQHRILFLNSVFVVAITWITYGVISISHKRWFLGLLGFSIVGGDFLPNAGSIAPIGISSISFFCSAALAISVVHSEPGRQRKTLLVASRLFLLFLYVSIVAVTRNDQMMLLSVLIFAIALPHSFSLLKNLGNETKQISQLILRFLLVCAVVPGLLFVRGSGSWQVVPSSGQQVVPSSGQVVPLGDVELVGETRLSVKSYVEEFVKSPGYFLLDFAPSWSDMFRSRVPQAAAGLFSLLIVVAMLRHVLHTRNSRLVLLAGVAGYFYVVSYGIIWGPRAELRYLWNLFLGVVLVSLFSNDWSQEISWRIRRLFTAGFLTSASLNLVALASNFDTEKKYWWSDSYSWPGVSIFLLTLMFGCSLSIVYVCYVIRQPANEQINRSPLHSRHFKTPL